MTERGDVRAVLEDLLDGLRSGAIAPPSTTAATVCFKLCEELASHLCSLVGAAPQPLLAKGAGSFLPTACDSQCTTSESDSETAHAKGRPSGRSRARFRRRQQQMQDQAPMTSYELHQAGFPVPSAAHAPPQWQQWQWAWQEHPNSAPLPGVLEQQEQQVQHFTQSLWSGGWVMVPVVPSPSGPSAAGTYGVPALPPRSATVAVPAAEGTAACEQLDASEPCGAHRGAAGAGGTAGGAEGETSGVVGGEQGGGSEVGGASGRLSLAVASLAVAAAGHRTEMPPEPERQSRAEAQLRSLVIRAGSVRRWRLAQRVWTQWMRARASDRSDAESAGEASTV